MKLGDKKETDGSKELSFSMLKFPEEPMLLEDGSELLVEPGVPLLATG
jgi:hypothetical protein